VDRRDIGSWMSGPPLAGEESYRGERLGLPATGSGSVAGFGRRLAALTIDWAASIALSRLLFGQFTYGTPESGLTILAIFVVEVVVLTWLTAASFGQRLLGIGVVRVDGRRLGLLPVLLRTVLLCLVVPPLVYDRDGRGLHDKAVGSVVVRLGRA
jgi:uncharacterized RDD family membrane protein YckC